MLLRDERNRFLLMKAAPPLNPLNGDKDDNGIPCMNERERESEK